MKKSGWGRGAIFWVLDAHNGVAVIQIAEILTTISFVLFSCN